MNVSPRLWIATCAALVLLIGVSAGVFVDRTWLTPRATAPGPAGFGMGMGGPGRMGGGMGPSAERIVNDLDAELHFTPEQRSAIAAILETHRPHVQQVQRDARQRFVEEQQALQDAIAGTLTPDQAARFRELVARQPGRLGPAGPGRGPGGRGEGGPG
jgi:Spy/CpxP family protein refolding chaperone